MSNTNSTIPRPRKMYLPPTQGLATAADPYIQQQATRERYADLVQGMGGSSHSSVMSAEYEHQMGTLQNHLEQLRMRRQVLEHKNAVRTTKQINTGTAKMSNVSRLQKNMDHVAKQAEERNEHFLSEFDRVLQRLNLTSAHSVPVGNDPRRFTARDDLGLSKRKYYGYVEQMYHTWHNERANRNAQQLVFVEKTLNSLEERRLLAKEAFERHLYTKERLVQRQKDLLLAKEAQRKEASDMKLNLSYLTQQERDFKEAFDVASAEANSAWKSEKLDHLNDSARKELNLGKSKLASELTSMYQPGTDGSSNSKYNPPPEDPQLDRRNMSASDNLFAYQRQEKKGHTPGSQSSMPADMTSDTDAPVQSSEGYVRFEGSSESEAGGNGYKNAPNKDLGAVKKLIDAIEINMHQDSFNLYNTTSAVTDAIRTEIMKMAYSCATKEGSREGDMAVVELTCWGPDSLSISFLDLCRSLTIENCIIPETFAKSHWGGLVPGGRRQSTHTSKDFLNEQSLLTAMHPVARKCFLAIKSHVASVVRHGLVELDFICLRFGEVLSANLWASSHFSPTETPLHEAVADFLKNCLIETAYLGESISSLKQKGETSEYKKALRNEAISGSHSSLNASEGFGKDFSESDGGGDQVRLREENKIAAESSTVNLLEEEEKTSVSGSKKGSTDNLEEATVQEESQHIVVEETSNLQKMDEKITASQVSAFSYSSSFSGSENNDDEDATTEKSLKEDLESSQLYLDTTAGDIVTKEETVTKTTRAVYEQSSEDRLFVSSQQDVSKLEAKTGAGMKHGDSKGSDIDVFDEFWDS
eukprot:Nk52_evm49s266 gene=Nk52_evmTU49s266